MKNKSVHLLYSVAEDEVNNKLFPKDFVFGAATASYQVEGKITKKLLLLQIVNGWCNWFMSDNLTTYKN